MDYKEDEIHEMDPTNIIIGEDLNLCRDCHLNKNSDPGTSQQGDKLGYSTRVEALCDSLNLMDVWRQLHPTTGQFLFRRGGLCITARLLASVRTFEEQQHQIQNMS